VPPALAGQVPRVVFALVHASVDPMHGAGLNTGSGVRVPLLHFKLSDPPCAPLDKMKVPEEFIASRQEEPLPRSVPPLVQLPATVPRGGNELLVTGRVHERRHSGAAPERAHSPRVHCSAPPHDETEPGEEWHDHPAAHRCVQLSPEVTSLPLAEGQVPASTPAPQSPPFVARFAPVQGSSRVAGSGGGP